MTMNQTWWLEKMHQLNIPSAHESVNEDPSSEDHNDERSWRLAYLIMTKVSKDMIISSQRRIGCETMNDTQTNQTQRVIEKLLKDIVLKGYEQDDYKELWLLLLLESFFDLFHHNFLWFLHWEEITSHLFSNHSTLVEVRVLILFFFFRNYLWGNELKGKVYLNCFLVPFHGSLLMTSRESFEEPICLLHHRSNFSLDDSHAIESVSAEVHEVRKLRHIELWLSLHHPNDIMKQCVDISHVL